jgi:CHAT domain-containing protein
MQGVSFRKLITFTLTLEGEGFCGRINIQGTPDPDPTRGSAVSAAGTASATGTAVLSQTWDGKGYSHPYYWASFVIMGNWR